VRTTLDKIGATPAGSTASEFDAFMHAEVTKWEPVLKAANIRAQWGAIVWPPSNWRNPFRPR